MLNNLKYRKEYPQILENILADGGFNVTFCGFIGICEDTFYDWVKKYPKFASANKRGRAKAKSLFLEKVASGAFNEKKQFTNNGLVYLLAINCYGMNTKEQSTDVDSSSIADELRGLADRLPD